MFLLFWAERDRTAKVTQACASLWPFATRRLKLQPMKIPVLLAFTCALFIASAPAAAQDDPPPAALFEAPQMVSYRNGDAAIRFQDYDAALVLYREECDAGEAASCKSLGDMYRRAWATEQDYTAAEALYVQTCEMGETTGCLELANMLFEGRGLDQDYPRARGLYEDACDLGNPRGCAVLGNMMYAGMGGPRLREEGAELMRDACAAEVEYACNQVTSYGIDRGNARFWNPWGGN